MAPRVRHRHRIFKDTFLSYQLTLIEYDSAPSFRSSLQKGEIPVLVHSTSFKVVHILGIISTQSTPPILPCSTIAVHVTEHNVLAGVLAELGNVRTPAALLGGAALGTMFVPPKPGGNRRLHLLYTLLSTSAFTLQLVCVLSSTVRDARCEGGASG